MVAAGQLFARTEHGGYPVHLLGSAGYRVEWPGGSREYTSARRTIIALVNRTPNPARNAYDPKLTFDRYFRKGRFQRGTYPAIDVLSLFRPDPINQVTVAHHRVPVRSDSTLAVQFPLGIDLARRGIEVRKLFFAGYAGKVIRRSYDPEDMLQEVYKALLVRNLGKCPFDSRKSSFAHYVHMVMSCTWSNYKRRYSRLERNEQFGSITLDGEVVDVASADLESTPANQDIMCEGVNLSDLILGNAIEAGKAEGYQASFVESCFEFMLLGLKYREMAERLSCAHQKVAEVVRFIRRASRELRPALMP